jgi:hypothetical protein
VSRGNWLKIWWFEIAHSEVALKRAAESVRPRHPVVELDSIKIRTNRSPAIDGFDAGFLSQIKSLGHWGWVLKLLELLIGKLIYSNLSVFQSIKVRVLGDQIQTTRLDDFQLFDNG